MITGQEDTRIPKNKRPGPKRSPCPHCGLTDCSHCRCPGTPLCCHEGKMCTNHRYRRRLVCNPCEKNRIKYQTHYATSMKSHADDASAADRSFLCGSVPDPLFQDVLDNESEQYENGGVLSGSYTNSNDFSQQCCMSAPLASQTRSSSLLHGHEHGIAFVFACKRFHANAIHQRGRQWCSLLHQLLPVLSRE